ncbi:MAG: SCO family protein [Bacteroidota bacterium]
MQKGASSKKKYTYIWVSAVVLVFGIFTVKELTERLGNDTVVATDRMSNAIAADNLSYIVSDGKKRKIPNFSFTNQEGKPITNQDFLGKVYVVDFFFTTCPTICPLMTSNLAEIQKTFSDRSDFAMASFTINPRYDTPEVLKAYAKKYEANTEKWSFITGPQPEIYELSKNGFHLLATENADAPGGFEHSGLFALVDKDGYLRSRTDAYGNPLIYYRGTVSEAQGTNKAGEPQQITMLKEDIQKLLSE